LHYLVLFIFSMFYCFPFKKPKKKVHFFFCSLIYREPRVSYFLVLFI